jgi:sec-independent protein translocase protein TatC
MSFLDESQIFGKKILTWLWLFIAAFGFFFAFGIKPINFQFSIFNFQLPIPVPNLESISTLFFKKIQQDLLIKDLELITTNPLDAVWAQIGISLFLAFIVTLPFLLYKIAAYFSPALFEKEKRAVLKALIPCIILFIGGCAFAYFFIVPTTFKILYSYVLAMGARPFFAINQFVSLVLILVLGTGLLFLLPVFMTLLSRLKIVSPDTWKKNWRYAILVFLILAAIITPDGTGITMALLAVPLIMLYGIGCIGSKKLS